MKLFTKKSDRSWRIYFGFTLALMLFALAGSLYYVNGQAEVEERTALYVTLAAQPLANESSSYELQRAAEHFSDMVLGWTVEPGFETPFEFTGRRQEKQNLLFIIESDQSSDAELLLEEINERISVYNLNSSSNYVIALQSISEADQTLNRSRIVLGALLLSALVSTFLIVSYDTFTSHRR